jgi:GNAT superfamily N-acetyltransferase
MTFTLRLASIADRDAIAQLIDVSARGLSTADYSAEQIEAALRYVYGVDTDLIADGTYFVAERDGMLLGCGGWSKRRTLFGGDQSQTRDAGFLDPRTDAARIRAFFIHPNAARQGIGRAILDACEHAAREAGFRSLQLVATLPGQKLYRACGFVAEKSITHTTPDGVVLEFVRMAKRL